jgi:hypothetical protein
MLRPSSTWIISGLDRSEYGMSQTLKGPGSVANGLTGIKNELVQCLFILNYN